MARGSNRTKEDENKRTYAQKVDGVPNPAHASTGERVGRLVILGAVADAQAGRKGRQQRSYSDNSLKQWYSQVGHKRVRDCCWTPMPHRRQPIKYVALVYTTISTSSLWNTMWLDVWCLQAWVLKGGGSSCSRRVAPAAKY